MSVTLEIIQRDSSFTIDEEAMDLREVKIGDFVMYKCTNTGEMISGLVSDVFDDDSLNVSPHPMYEVISIEPPDRVWLAQHEMSVISASS